MYFFTSITNNYMAKAKLLCRTLKQHNPKARFILSLADEMPQELETDYHLFDDIIMLEDIQQIDNLDSFKYKYTVTEICTAVKPLVAKKILQEYDTEKVVYLDPDIAVFESFDALEKILDSKSMVFTPHQTKWDVDDSFIKSNEILFLKRGSMNLGFFAVKKDKEGLCFLDWWGKRLLEYCFDDDYETLKDLEKDGLLGMFTDQKWIDLVPSFFDNYYILKKPGYNLSTWNLTNRIVTKEQNGKFKVNGEKIYFFHFSGFDSGGHLNELQRVCRINPENKIVKQLSDWYEKELDKEGQKIYEKKQYAFQFYFNGKKINNFERKIYLIRKDIHHLFKNPFDNESSYGYYNWLSKNYKEYFKKEKSKRKKNNREKIGRFIRNLGLKIFPRMTKRNEIAKKIYYKVLNKKEF